jgi:hypothetical protein
MLDLESGDRIELFYEDTLAEDASAATMSARVVRLLSDQEEGMGVEIEEYTACWIEITLEEPCEIDTKQVVLLGTDCLYRLNGRQVTIRKKQD